MSYFVVFACFDALVWAITLKMECAALVYCRIFSRKKKKNRTVSNDPFPWSTISNFSPNVLLGATNINTCTLNVDRYMYQLLLKNFLQIRFILFVYLFVCLHLRISFIVFYIYVSVYVLWMCVCVWIVWKSGGASCSTFRYKYRKTSFYDVERMTTNSCN